MPKQTLVLMGWMALSGALCAATGQRPAPGPAMPDAGERRQVQVAAGSRLPDAAASPCQAMRATWDTTESSDGAPSPRVERALEEAIRRYYLRKVLARGIDKRGFARHPVVFSRLGTALGAAVAGCVEEWRAADPDGIVPDESPRFAADHRYAEVTFEFNDAADGENAYTAFIDVATLQVVVMFHYNNFEP